MYITNKHHNQQPWKKSNSSQHKYNYKHFHNNKKYIQQ